MMISFVVPCYNEEAVLPETARRLSALIDGMVENATVSDTSGIYFVDDGSRDQTWDFIAALQAARPERYHGIKLSRNCGHQAAFQHNRPAPCTRRCIDFHRRRSAG